MEIEICMGSSCYARGNRENVEFIRQYLRDNAVEADVRLTGCLCTGNCRRGPVIKLGETLYSEVDPVLLRDLLEEAIPEA